MNRDFRQEQHLITALVGERHVRLYQTSATFKTQVDVLAAMLSAWADGIAASAVSVDESMELAKQAVMSGPMLLRFPSLEGRAG